ncbi:MAG: hypothetical protein F6K30_05480 [Cyanothece sp. SIO2G6]|nr:hypothetical protein [Cyanothece sp. SIO2G6]
MTQLEEMVPGCVTLHEMSQTMDVSLSDLHRAILVLLQNRTDLVVFGAYAVNAYLKPADVRMTADVDIQSTQGRALAEEISQHLHQKFYIATRIREIGDNKAWRIYQRMKSGNRHLVDIRQVETLPTFKTINDIQVLSPVQLMTAKVISAYARQNQPKGFSDLRDLYSLMLTFPELTEQVQVDPNNGKLQDFWQNIQDRGVEPPDSDDDLLY